MGIVAWRLMRQGMKIGRKCALLFNSQDSSGPFTCSFVPEVQLSIQTLGSTPLRCQSGLDA